LEVVESNLDDLNRAVGERHGPWPFRLEDWVRPEVVYELAERLRLVSGGELSARTREVRSFLARRPEVERLVPILLERGDPEGRSFAINLATIGQTPELLSALHDFVFSRNGSDQSRIEATEVLLRTSQMQPGTHQVWIKGRWEKSLIMGAIIHGEPVKNVGKKATPLVDSGLQALHAGDGARAESLFRQALLIEPDNPMLINNLISSLDLQGRDRETEEMMVELHRQFPDYLFGRIAMAALAVKKGEFERAQEYLNPIYERRRLHFSEFRALAFTRIDLALARGDREDARLWFEHLEQIYPDARRLENYRLRVRDPSAAKDQE
ncbi:MAG TPA: hypothetical protein VJ302_33215, partial [Blastocatellia bacterium]|nr:hypothetical protein [Blastocatellia bacterium]